MGHKSFSSARSSDKFEGLRRIRTDTVALVVGIVSESVVVGTVQIAVWGRSVDPVEIAYAYTWKGLENTFLTVRLYITVNVALMGKSVPEVSRVAAANTVSHNSIAVCNKEAVKLAGAARGNPSIAG